MDREAQCAGVVHAVTELNTTEQLSWTELTVPMVGWAVYSKTLIRLFTNESGCALSLFVWPE